MLLLFTELEVQIIEISGPLMKQKKKNSVNILHI